MTSSDYLEKSVNEYAEKKSELNVLFPLHRTLFVLNLRNKEHEAYYTIYG